MALAILLALFHCAPRAPIITSSTFCGITYMCRMFSYISFSFSLLLLLRCVFVLRLMLGGTAVKFSIDRIVRTIELPGADAAQICDILHNRIKVKTWNLLAKYNITHSPDVFFGCRPNIYHGNNFRSNVINKFHMILIHFEEKKSHTAQWPK